MDTLLIENEVIPKRKRIINMHISTAVENESFVNNERLKRKLIKDIGDKSFEYFQSIPFIFNVKVLYFSPSRHYLYQPVEYSNLDAIINLRQINSINDLTKYIQNINELLPMGGYYVGSYKDYKYELKNKKSFLGFNYFMKVLNLINNKLVRIKAIRNFYFFMNSAYSQPMTLKDIRRYFQQYGFSVVNIQHLEGFTYFLLIKMTNKPIDQNWFGLFGKREKAMIIEL